MAIGAQAASVGAGGYTNDFSTQPAAADWSTGPLGTAPGAYATADQLDAGAQTVVASTVTAAVVSDAANPPAINTSATWSSAGLYLQTRPTTVGATLLMCTLVNGLGGNASAATVSYDFVKTATAAEEIEGQRAYYSLTGAAGSWTVIPEFSSATPGRLTANLNVAWAAGGTLYLLWADDNGTPSPDTACQIDNFSVRLTPAVQVPASILVQPTNATVTELSPVTFSVVAGGNPLPTYQWYQNSTLIPGATSASYTIASVPLSYQNAGFSVVASNYVTNVSYVVTSSVATLSVQPDLIPPTVLRLLPGAGSSVPALTEIEVDFSERVTGVNAADLLINGSPATNVDVRSADVYVFKFPQPATGTVQVAWSTPHGITDLAANANPFTGVSFTYTVTASAPLGDVRITEFMASNTRTLSYQEGGITFFDDWIEIQNVDTFTVNLQGWYLTDSAGNLRKWSFPATNLGPGQFMIIWASGKDRRIPGAPLHTNFKLDASPGEYLALVQPDGQTIASEYSPRYPAQVADVSYGLAIAQSSFTLVATNAPVRAFVPTSGSLSNAWTLTGFDDGDWISGTNGVGYDTGAVNAGEDLASSIIQASGPVAYFRLNETSGTAAANIGSGGVNGTYQGGPTLGAAGPRPPTYGGFEPGNAAPQFNGTSAYVAGPAGLLNNQSTFTMSGWIRPATLTANRTGLFGQNDLAEFGFISTGNLQFWTFVGSIDLAYPFPADEWHHVACVANGATFALYLDGTSRATATMSGAIGTSAFSFNIGGGGIFDTSGNFFNGLIDEVAVWTRALSAAEILQQYQAAFTPTATATYSNLIGTDMRSTMFGVNSSCYARYLFNVEDLSQVDRLTLRLKYDDGFAAYLNGSLVAYRNAPTEVLWNSAATTYNPDGAVLNGEEFNISQSAGTLRLGTNVLAIQGLNTSATNADFLIYAELIGTSVGEYATTPRYFTVPTPGNVNGAGTADLGPVISEVGRAPAPPTLLTTNDPITVTARVQPAFAPVANVTLNWRVMWGATNQLQMFDDGQHGDGGTNDGIFGAIIPAGVATNGQMIRWFIQASDSAGRPSRWPLFANPLTDPEYEGTMMSDPAAVSQLQMWYFFVQPGSPSFTSIDTESGGRLSMFFAGEFYDNIYMELRGNTTAGYPKKSHRVEFTPDRPLKNAIPGWALRHTSLLSEQADPAYLRTHLSFWLLQQMGVASPFDYPVHCRLNGQFWGLWFHNDVIGSEQLDRLGYDSLGALYKAAGQVVPSEASTGVFEKKTRLWEDHTDYQTLARTINETNSLANRRAFIFDNLNLPEIITYLAVARWTQEGDDVWANMSLYRDTLGTKEWFIIPFDLNVSWGQLYCGDNTANFQFVIATNDNTKSHPLYGGSQVIPTIGGTSWNRIYDVIVAVPETRQMLLRRERTLLEQFIQPPGTPFEQGILEQHIAYMTNLMWPEMFLDRAKWGWPSTTVGTANGMYCWGQAWPTNNPYGIPGLFDSYIYPRRIHWWSYHSLTNTARPVGLGNAFNAGIPISQPANAFLTVGDLDYNPASGNQDQEYICLTNATPFALDISGWKLDGAVNFTFKPGTIVPSNSVVYVSPNVLAFRSRTTGPRGGQGNFVVGPYQGQLSARGETIRLQNEWGVVVSTKTYTGSPSLAQQQLRITEIMYHPSPLNGNPTPADEFEYLEFKNISATTALNLNGIRLANGIVFDFTASAVTNLGPGEAALLVRNTNAFIARYGASPRIAGQFTPYQLGNGGERLQILDANGEEILDFSYDNKWYPITDGAGFSLVVVNENAEPDAWNNKSNWRPSGRVDGSPGTNDPAPPTLVPVVINEALTRSDTPPPPDTIELYNPTGTSANIGGWFLTDEFATPKKYRIADGTTLPGGSYVTFDESQFNPTPGTPPSFALNAQGDQVYLFSADAAGNLTGYVHGYDFGASDTNMSFGRHITSDGKDHFVAQTAITLGTNNAGPRTGPVVINEIMYHPPEVDGTNDNTLDEFIELRNITAEAVVLYEPAWPIHTWKITGGVDFTFPENVTLTPGESVLLVNFNPADATLLAAFRAKYGVGSGVRVFGPYNGKLNNAGDDLELKKPTLLPLDIIGNVLVDEVEFKDGSPWPSGADGFGLSLQRKDVHAYGNEPANWLAALPTAAADTPSGGTPPTLTSEPASQTVLAYSPVTLSASASGDAPLRYQWRLNGENLPGATNATLQLASIQAPDTGDYRVLVYNAFGSAVSSNATLTLNYPASILVQPQSLSVFPLTNASFSVLAFSSSDITYQWRSNGVDIPGATSATYTIANVQPYHQADYAVVVSDASGANLSSPARLTVFAHPVFTLQPSNRVVVVGTGSINVTSVVAAVSSTPIRYQWLLNGTNLPTRTNTSLIITNVQLSDAGDYAVVATDGYGSLTSTNGTLLVALRPAITEQPPNLTVQQGQDAVFTAAASGTAPMNFRWRRNGATYTNGIIVSGVSSSTLTMTNVAYTNDADKITVVVTNITGSQAVSASTNGILRVLYPPVLTSEPTNQVVSPGSNATFRAVFRSNPALSYQWWFNETNLLGSASNVEATNAQTITLTVTNSQATNEGIYRLVLSNQYGVTLSTGATLALRKPPTILAQPQNQTNVVGSTATFSLTLGGTPPFSYAWRFNGTNLPSAVGTNAALVLTNVQTAQAGGYAVVVTNLMGSVTSVVATLTVVQSTTITAATYDPATGKMQFSFVTSPGSSYFIEYKNALDDPAWQPLQTIPGDGTEKTFQDPVQQPPPSQRFYRVRVQ